MKREKKDLSRTFKKGVGRIRKGAGFTLIELMVVVVIIGILAAVALPRFMIQQRKAKEGAAWADLDSMTTACEMYYLDIDHYPKAGSTVGGVAAAIPSDGRLAYLVARDATDDPNNQWAGPYMKFRRASSNIPLDPWGNQYGIESDTDGTVYTVWCYGGKYVTNAYSAYYINRGWFKSP